MIAPREGGNDHPSATSTGMDRLLIANTGAYGAAMSSRYNLREPAGEVILG